MTASEGRYNSLVYLMHEVNHKVCLDKEKVLGREGISFPQMIVLGFLRENADEDVNLKAICSIMKIKGSSVTSLVNNMVKNGLIEKRTNPCDGRECFLTLTDKGMEKATRIREMLRVIDEEATGVLTEEEKNTMVLLLRKLLFSGETE